MWGRVTDTERSTSKREREREGERERDGYGERVCGKRGKEELERGSEIGHDRPVGAYVEEVLPSRFESEEYLTLLLTSEGLKNALESALVAIGAPTLKA